MFINIIFQGVAMEFLELLMVLIAMILIIKKPEKEKLAFNLVMISWVIMIVLYIAHKSSALLTNMNL